MKNSIFLNMEIFVLDKLEQLVLGINANFLGELLLKNITELYSSTL
jgi:hypothetical protein